MDSRDLWDVTKDDMYMWMLEALKNALDIISEAESDETNKARQARLKYRRIQLLEIVDGAEQLIYDELYPPPALEHTSEQSSSPQT